MYWSQGEILDFFQTSEWGICQWPQKKCKNKITHRIYDCWVYVQHDNRCFNVKMCSRAWLRTWLFQRFFFFISTYMAALQSRAARRPASCPPEVGIACFLLIIVQRQSDASCLSAAPLILFWHAASMSQLPFGDRKRCAALGTFRLLPLPR